MPARVGEAAAAAVGVELLEQVRAEQPMLAGLGDREQLLAAAWLIGYRSARTRAAYAADYTGWVAWLTQRGVDVLAARRTHVDLWAHQLAAAGAASSSIGRRLSALSGFYRHAAAHDLITRVPTDGVRRPVVDPDHTATVGLDRAQARALIAAADTADTPQAIRNAAVIRLLIHNGLRVDEAISADVADLGYDRGHRTLTIVRKGGRRARVALAPATGEAIDTYLRHRADSTGVVDPRQLAGPLLVTVGGTRLTQSTLWRLVRSLARTAGIPAAEQLSPHSLRHTAITLALDAGVPLRDVQDYAGHRDARTTRRYDHTRGNLDRHAAYTIAAYLA